MSMSDGTYMLRKDISILDSKLAGLISRALNKIQWGKKMYFCTGSAREHCYFRKQQWKTPDLSQRNLGGFL